MIPAKLSDWTYEAVASLCATGQGESERHEFKSILPNAISLTKLCCAFANSAGGFVIVGVRDAKGEPFEPIGIDPDKELFGNFIARVRATPDIPIEQPALVEIPNSPKRIYAFEVKQSLRSPHLPIPADERVFWKRQGSSCVQMTLEEIRYQMNSHEEKREKLALLMIDLRHKVEALKSESYLSPGGYAPAFGQTYSCDIIDRVVVEAYSFLKADPSVFQALHSFKGRISELNAAKQRMMSAVATNDASRGISEGQAILIYHSQLSSVLHHIAALAQQIRRSIKEIADVDDPYGKI